MTVKRIVPNLTSRSLPETRAFYEGVLGMEPVMDHGWVVTYAQPGRPAVQISLLTHDETGPVIPVASIQVDDVDAAYALAQASGARIVHPITDEPWGVRRFFVEDPDGNVVNVLSHQ